MPLPGKPWRGHPGPVAAPCGHGRAAARADAGSEPGGRVGEWAAHGIMGEEGLVARVARGGRRHGSYGGGVPGAPPNLLRDERGRRDLGADAPNGRWVTDVTEFHVPAGLVSGKGRGPGDARCEGLFGRPETGFSCGCDRGGAATGELAGMLDAYLRWHGDAGTRSDPGHGSLTRHGRDLGSAARTWAS